MNIVQEFVHNGWKVLIVMDDDCVDLNPMNNEGNLGHVINNRIAHWRTHYGERVKDDDQIIRMMAEEADEYFFFPFNAGEMHGPGTFSVDFNVQRQLPSGVVRVSKKQAREDWPDVKNEAKLKELCLERVKVSKDWDGFFWVYPDSKIEYPKRPYHGGIINHGARDNESRWSIHT